MKKEWTIEDSNVLLDAFPTGIVAKTVDNEYWLRLPEYNDFLWHLDVNETPEQIIQNINEYLEKRHKIYNNPINAFKVGPAKTKSKLAVEILEVSDFIYGKIEAPENDTDMPWRLGMWKLNGAFALWSDQDGYYDLELGSVPLYNTEVIVDKFQTYKNVQFDGGSIVIKKYGTFKVTITEIES